MNAFCVWLTGLPGSGKSTIALELKNILEGRGVRIQVLRLDELRKLITPNPKYTEEERDIVYRSLAVTAKILADNGVNVVIDATGHRRAFRDFARSIIENFFEIYVKCSVEVAEAREKNRVQDLVSKNLYEKAKSGKIALPGSSVPYEEPENPELVVDSDKIPASEAAERIFKILNLRV